MTITYNPFIGLAPDDARDVCFDIMNDFAETLPFRPSLPHETEESGAMRMLTDRAWAIYQKVEESARQALKEAGLDENLFNGPIQEY